MVARQQSPHVLEQEKCQVVLPVLQLHALSINLQCACIGKEPVTPELQHALRGSWVGPAQQCRHTRGEFTDAHGLDHEIVRATAQPFDNVALLAPVRDEQDR